MKFLDAFYMDETVSRQRHGEKDADWYYEEGTNTFGTQSYVNITDYNHQPYFDMSMNKLIVNPPILGIETHWNYLTVNSSNGERATQVNRLLKEAWDIKGSQGKKQAEVATQLVYTSEEYEMREEKGGPVASFITAQATLFMQGEKDPRDNKQWDEYKATLEKLGRNDLMKVAQSAYSRKAGK